VNQKLSLLWTWYVGLPLAVEFGKQFKTIGYDLSESKIANYRNFRDPTGDVSVEDLRNAKLLTVTSDSAHLASADYVIVAVPTPVDAAHQPDFSPLVSASASVGKHLKRGAIVIYESTVIRARPRNMHRFWSVNPA
jgi:UDP-N-acetyl-D-galactosamine dehydrogenase